MKKPSASCCSPMGGFNVDAVVTVDDTIKIGDTFFHLGTVTKGGSDSSEAQPAGSPAPAQAAGLRPFRAEPNDSKPHRLRVDESRRAKIASNHTMTHVMNHKLRAILGDHVAQKGSLVDDEKTRFDFAHNAGISETETAKIEELVNADIAADLPVHYDYAPQADALKIHGLRAVFGEKYPPTVRVVSIGPSLADLLKNPSNKEWENRSIEFCGGTHVGRTGDIGLFKITAEGGIASAIRRIEAVTGEGALEAVRAEDGCVPLQPIRVRFSEDVIVAQDDLNLQGLNAAPAPQVTQFTYDPASMTATWMFAAALLMFANPFLGQVAH